MSTQAVTSGAAKNDSGSVAYANAAAGSRVTNSVDFTKVASHSKPNGVLTAETDATIAAGTDTKGVYKPIAAGAYAGQQPRQYVINSVTTHIANVAFANGVFAGADWGLPRYPVPVESARTIHITDWSYVTGDATISGYTNDSFGTDQAARPSHSIPGELVYLATGATPTQDDYKSF